MHRIFLVIAVLTISLLTGCSGGGDTQSAFYHNNREHNQWVANPSHTPKFQNPNTGGPMFY